MERKCVPTWVKLVVQVLPPLVVLRMLLMRVAKPRSSLTKWISSLRTFSVGELVNIIQRGGNEVAAEQEIAQKNRKNRRRTAIIGQRSLSFLMGWATAPTNYKYELNRWFVARRVFESLGDANAESLPPLQFF